MEKIVDKRNVIWNIIGASANAFTSLLFSIVVTRINGTDDGGIFIYSFATACLLYFIGNYCGRTFQVTDITKKNSDTDYIYNRIITCVVMMIVSVGFTIIKGYDFYKAAILIVWCGYKCIEAFAESLYAVVQKNGKLYKVRNINVSKSFYIFYSSIYYRLYYKRFINSKFRNNSC